MMATAASEAFAVEVARDLIRCASVTGPGAEVEVVGVVDRILAGEDRVQRRVVAGRDDRPNLIATLVGPVAGPRLLLTGHLDVVPADPKAWKHHPFSGEMADGELWGRGSVDMKGGLAALTAVFMHVAQAGGPPCGELILAATADEEGEGRWGLPWLIAEGVLHADAAIVAEPAGVRSDYDRVPIATRGSVFALVRVTAPGGHASFGSKLGQHAVSAACRAQQALESGFRPSPATHWAFPDGPTVVAGESFRGGERAGELPATAEFTVSCRLLPGAEREQFFTELEAFLETVIPDGCSFEIRPNEAFSSWGPGMDLGVADPLARLALAAVRDAGYADSELGGFPAFSEGSWLHQAGVRTLPALGPGALAYAHRPDERLAIDAQCASMRVFSAIIDEVLAPGSEILKGAH
jgi:acetylornithine deacetylase/succinyl-diaminopimelate desuccinylase-like protein